MRSLLTGGSAKDGGAATLATRRGRSACTAGPGRKSLAQPTASQRREVRINARFPLETAEHRQRHRDHPSGCSAISKALDAKVARRTFELRFIAEASTAREVLAQLSEPTALRTRCGRVAEKMVRMRSAIILPAASPQRPKWTGSTHPYRIFPVERKNRGRA